MNLLQNELDLSLSKCTSLSKCERFDMIFHFKLSIFFSRLNISLFWLRVFHWNIFSANRLTVLCNEQQYKAEKKNHMRRTGWNIWFWLVQAFLVEFRTQRRQSCAFYVKNDASVVILCSCKGMMLPLCRDSSVCVRIDTKSSEHQIQPVFRLRLRPYAIKRREKRWDRCVDWRLLFTRLSTHQYIEPTDGLFVFSLCYTLQNIWCH